MQEIKKVTIETKPTVPKPVFVRLLLLFSGGAGCLLVGIIVSVTMRDPITLGMSVILSIAFLTKGILLKRKINADVIFRVSGVCVSIVPKILGRYRLIELIDPDSGGDAHLVLPKKIVFKIGHVYNCYFDNPHIKQQYRDHIPQDGSNSRFFIAEKDFPTTGFLGFEDLGIYQENPK